MTTEAPSVNMMGFAAVEGDEVKVSGDNDYHSGNITGPSVVSTGTRGGADNAPDFRIRLLGAQSDRGKRRAAARHCRHRAHPLGDPRRAERYQLPSPCVPERQGRAGSQRHH